MAGGRTTRHESLSTDPDEDTKFRLAFVEALGDAQVAAKLTTIMRAANKDLVDQVASLREEVRGLKTALADRDATIAQLQGEVRGLRLQNDALEQYGRRSSLRITGISEDHEDTTAAVLNLANEESSLIPSWRKRISTSATDCRNHEMPGRKTHARWSCGSWPAKIEDESSQNSQN